MIDEQAFLNKWKHLKGQKLVLACSGGLDSMVLFHLLKKITNKLTVLHVNYNFRGQESIDDSSFVAEICKQEKVDFRLKSIDSPNLLAENRQNLQEFARELRYKWFEEVLKEDENAILFLAHHFDDQIETFFMNLARKSGNLGLACMPEIYGKYHRPLLSFEKEEIYEFARHNKLKWREDSSNSTNKYTRNRLRNEFIPFVLEKIPSLKDSIAVLIDVFQENLAEIQNSTQEFILNIESKGVLTLADWDTFSDEQKIFILKSFDFNAKQVFEINKLRSSQKGKTIQSETHKLIKEEHSFSIIKKQELDQIPQMQIEKVDFLPAEFSKSIIYLDEAKISGKLKLRRWEIGDRIQILGLNGSKLISDVITNAKIRNVERKNVLVLHDDLRIHWCVNLDIGKNAIATKETQSILKIQLV